MNWNNLLRVNKVNKANKVRLFNLLKINHYLLEMNFLIINLMILKVNFVFIVYNMKVEFMNIIVVMNNGLLKKILIGMILYKILKIDLIIMIKIMKMIIIV